MADFGTVSATAPQQLTVAGSAVYFASANGLWRTDGTKSGTALVEAFGPLLQSAPQQLTAVGGTLYFSADDGSAGRELWKTDGTPAGTVLVKDINPGSAASNPQQLTDVGGRLYFVANDGTHGYELWSSDGTAAGTAMAADLNPGGANSNPASITAFDGKTFFTANDGADGRQLYSSDGTAPGTSMVKFINAFGNTGTDVVTALTPAGNTLFFTTYGHVWWKTDGTADGTTQVLTDTGAAPPLGIFGSGASGSTFYFTTNDTTRGFDLWSVNGSADPGAPAGTAGRASLVKTFVPTVPSVSTAPGNFTGANGQMFFAADDGTGSSLWVSGGTGATTVALPAPGPTALLPVGNKVFFVASDGYAAGMPAGAELWSSDGTAAGTARVKDIDPGPGGSAPSNLTNVAGKLFFSANDGTHGNELWSSDGTPAGTTLAADLNTAASSAAPTLLTPFNNALYFTTSAGGLYTTDGTAAGTALVSSVSPGLLQPAGNVLYFTAGAGTADPAIWKTDGTAAGTIPVKDFPLPAQVSLGSITGLYANNGLLYFSLPAYTTANGYTTNLWASDGTPAGTRLLSGPAGGPFPVGGAYFTPLNNKVYFFAAPSNSNSTNGYDLWSTDGTPAGTTPVAPVTLGSAPTGPSGVLQADLAAVNGKLIFPAYSYQQYYDLEPWISDGTSIALLADLTTTPPRSGGRAFQFDPYAPGSSIAVLGGYAYWLGPDPTAKNLTLWRTDGTAKGTSQVATINALLTDYDAFDLTVVGNQLLFVDQGSNYEFDLWRSDGTAAGTSVLHRFSPKAAPPGGQTFPLQGVGPITVANNIAYFSTADIYGNTGTELWQSDGTTAGTVQTADLNPGPASSNPSALTAVGNNLFFLATDATSGTQIWEAASPAAAPPAPANLTAVPASPFSVTLSWQPGGDVLTYRIDRSRVGDFSTIDASFAAGAAATGFTDPVADPNTTFYYRVVGVNSAGPSAPATAQVTTPPAGWPAGTVIPADPSSAGTPSYALAQGLVPFHGSIFFTAYDYSISLPCVYRTDGTTVTKIFSGVTSDLDPEGGAVYFSGPSKSVWMTDGTAAGTRLAPNGFPSHPSTSPFPGAPTLGTKAFYTDITGSGDGAATQLFAADTATGARTQLTQFPAGNVAPQDLFVANGALYFFAPPPGSNPATTTYALWKSDGTPQGTVPVCTLPTPPSGYSYGTSYGQLTSANGTLFFSDGGALWASDGTATGTAKLRTFNYSRGFPIVTGLTVVNDRLYFAYQNPTGQSSNGTQLYTGQLWTSDGTAAGTVQIPGLAKTQSVTGDSPSDITADGDTVYFVADAGTDPTTWGQVYHYTPAPFTLALPAAPTNVAGTAASAGEIDLTWTDNANNEQGYTVQRSTDPAFGTIDSTVSFAANVTRYADLGLSPGTTYYYRVVAFNDGGASAAVTSGPVATTGGPAAPTALVASNAVPGQEVDLTWVDKATDETGYVLQRSSNPDFFPASAVQLNVPLPPNTTAYQDKTVTRLTQYYYRVYAVNAAGQSSYASAAIATPESAPAGPTGLVAGGVSASEIDLQWQNNAVNADPTAGYRVERAGPDGVFAEIAKLPSTALSYSDSGLPFDASYTYRVRAVNGVGPSPYSNTVAAQTLAPQLYTPITQLPALPSASGPAHANPTAVYTADNGTGFFIARPDFVGAHLQVWRTDGTAAGTSLVYDIDPAKYPGSATVLGTAGNNFYFTLQPYATGAVTLWKSDGTAAGTAPVQFLFNSPPGGTRFNDQVLDQSAPINGRLVFLVTVPGDPSSTVTPNGIGVGLFSTDGTANGVTRLNANAGGESLTPYNGKLYFQVFNVGWYQTDGTPAGTVPTSDYVPYSGGAAVEIGPLLYSADESGVHVSDGTPGPGTTLYASPAFHVAAAGSQATFWVQQKDSAGVPRFNNLWATDGTAAGTRIIAQYSYFDPSQLVTGEAGNAFYFAIGSRLYRSDLTPGGTAQITSFTSGVTQLAPVGSKMTFQVNQQLWSTDGTPAGTKQVSFVPGPVLPAHPDWMTDVNGTVYFVSSSATMDAPTGGGGAQLWKTDGTAGGTVQLLSANTIRDLTNVNGTLFFSASTPQTGDELWKSDGTPAGTVMVKDIVAGGGSSTPRPVGVLNNLLFFVLGNSSISTQNDLWVSDGSAAGTHRLGNANGGAVAYYFDSPTAPRTTATAGGYFYFVDGRQSDQPNAGNLWRTDGTAAGTVQISGLAFIQSIGAVGDTVYAASQNILYKVAVGGTSATQLYVFGAPYSYMITDLTGVGSTLYFTAPDGSHGLDLWKSDGTAAGTVPVFDPVADGTLTPSSGRPYDITDVNGTAYFLAAAGYNGTPSTDGALWKSDGTAAGTVRVRPVNVAYPAQYSPPLNPVYLTAINGFAVYSDGEHVWRSDGTYAGTVQIDDIGTAPDGSKPQAPFGGPAAVVLGDRLFYSAADTGGGRDLRVATLTPPTAPAGLTAAPVAGAGGGASTGGGGLQFVGGQGAANAVRLTWTENSNVQSGFVIQRSTAADFSAGVQSFFAPASATSFTDTSATGGPYYYRIRAIDAGGSSAYSNTVAGGSPASAPAVVTVGDGSARRSIIDSLTVTFAGAVTPNAGALTLARLLTASDGTVLSSTDVSSALSWSNPSGDGRTWVLTFAANSAAADAYGSLTDGVYRLTLHPGLVTSASGSPLSGPDVTLSTFSRLFGDVNGDGQVNGLDFFKFSKAYGATKGRATYDPAFDYNQNGAISALDYAQIKKRYGTTFTVPPS